MKLFLPLTVILLIHFPSAAQRVCGFTGYQQELIGKTPGLANRIQEIEGFTRSHLQAKMALFSVPGQPTLQLSLITIPVVVHIVYNTSAQNISDAQIASQIEVLNRDYRKQNPDTSGIPAYYKSLAADCGFQFVLARVDTNGYATNGIVRKHTNVQAFNVDDHIKFSADGGDDAWDRDRYLNIWVGNLTGGTLGYSSVVGGPAAIDGVTVLYTAFGTTGTAAAPFNLGRTATHEIGHWLNLIHVWGDASCGNDDVGDTPQQQTATEGDPSGPVISCGNAPYGNLYMDYMDFTDDIGMHMFTFGQRDRMHTLFEEGGARYPLLSSNAITAIPIGASVAPVTVSSGPSTQNLSVYPNPAIDAVSVTMTDGSLIGSPLEVYNLVGQKMMTSQVSKLSFPLNVSSLAKGVYIIRIGNGKQVATTKLVKL